MILELMMLMDKSWMRVVKLVNGKMINLPIFLEKARNLELSSFLSFSTSRKMNYQSRLPLGLIRTCVQKNQINRDNLIESINPVPTNNPYFVSKFSPVSIKLIEINTGSNLIFISNSRFLHIYPLIYPDVRVILIFF